jgi:hypothetical protein
MWEMWRFAPPFGAAFFGFPRIFQPLQNFPLENKQYLVSNIFIGGKNNVQAIFLLIPDPVLVLMLFHFTKKSRPINKNLLIWLDSRLQSTELKREKMTTPPLQRTTSEGKGPVGRLFTQHPPLRCWHCGGHRLKQIFQRILIDFKCPCCGSGSVISMFLGLLDPDPGSNTGNQRYGSRSGSFYH